MSIYVVTGRHRTGTSMMMAALAAGGLSPVIDPNVEADIRTRVVSDYDPNPEGFWPAPRDMYPHHLSDGQVIKCAMYAWPGVQQGDYKVVRMVRDEEIRSASFYRVFGARESIIAYENGEANLLTRSDCHVISLDYDEVLANPHAAFNLLVVSGWAIDPLAAAQVPNRS